jgi:hypothetical protein
MKRFGFFLLWTLVFWLVVLMMGRQFSVFSSRELWREDPEPTSIREGFRTGLRAGRQAREAGRKFLHDYWHISLAASAAVAGIGSIAGVLPGARKQRAPLPPPLP